MDGCVVNLSYRDAGIEDLPGIVEIYNSTIPLRMVTADTEAVTLESRLGWFEAHTPAKRPLWVVSEGTSRIIGWVSFQDFYGRPAYDRTAEISIYLDNAQRGKGFGKIILQHCIDVCPSFGIKTLLGFIFEHNEPSLMLFRRLGFDDWGTLQNVAVIDGIERSLKIVGKRIT